MEDFILALRVWFLLSSHCGTSRAYSLENVFSLRMMKLHHDVLLTWIIIIRNPVPAGVIYVFMYDAVGVVVERGTYKCVYVCVCDALFYKKRTQSWHFNHRPIKEVDFTY